MNTNHAPTPRRLRTQIGLRTLLAIVYAAGVMCWIFMRVSLDAGHLNALDLLGLFPTFVIWTIVAGALSVLVLPRWFDGLPLHLMRGLIFGLLAAPCFVHARCGDTFPVPAVYLIFLSARRQLFQHPAHALATIGPGVWVVGIFATAWRRVEARR